MPAEEEYVRLLQDLGAGSKAAEDRLLPLLYDELRALARHYMRSERPGHTLQTTALVHEAYLRFGGDKETAWESKRHFMRVASRAMRRVLIDHARRRHSVKKGGGRSREPLERAADLFEEAAVDPVMLDAALDRLGAVDPTMVQIVELRFFGGLTLEETARVLGVSRSTVKQDWTLAKAWLRQQMG